MYLKNFGFVTSIIIILLLPVIGYAVMNGLAYIIPPSNDEDMYYYSYTSLLLILLMVIPYIMLKFFFHALHIKNHKEPELRLEDLPKIGVITNYPQNATLRNK